ncbi:MAG: ACP S-malonyltransferase [Treponema sp.]|jgi:[acyl-carrier-protein] S-malonyltransferase|nr:ACP S-malonyltransferase [Treponema sp.]
MDFKKIVFLFPGQGAQYPGMGLDLLESRTVKILFDAASDITGKDMGALLRNTDGETLKRTDISQPAITLVNLSAAAFLAERGIHPAACAGFSLGEYAALRIAGLLSLEDCFRLVKYRGEVMQEAADRLREAAESASGDVSGSAPGMAAVVGLAPDQVESLIAGWKAGGPGVLADLYPANINSPRQTVVSGTGAALAEAESRFKEAGARRFIRLQVAGPFHSPLISGAAEKFRPLLEKTPFGDPLIPLYSNVTGKRVASGEEAKKLALAQITGPVRWTDEEKALNEAGDFDAALETGPGKVLQGLWKDSGSPLPCYPAGSRADIEGLNIGGRE